MATEALPVDAHASPSPRSRRAAEQFGLYAVARALASLQLTVFLLAAAIFLILVGTLAQIDHDIWHVVRHAIFRVWIARVDFQLFFPRSWSVPGFIYFPGGALIGLAMAINLVAAHCVRFKLQASGGRLVAGLVTLAAGVGVTWGVVQSGMNIGEPNAAPLLEWASLWKLIKIGLAISVAATIYPIIMLPDSRKTLWWSLVGYVFVGGGLLVWLLAHPEFMFHPASMRILWQLLKAGAAALVLLAACELLFHRRAGVVLIHFGIGMLMLGELIVAKSAEEGMMFIREGQTAHYVEDMRAVELAVIDASSAQEERVVSIPASRLKPGAVVRHDSLPFQIKVSQYFKNSTLKRREQERPAEGENDQTASRANWSGTGADFSVEEAPIHTGVESAGGVDFAAAIVECENREDGAPLGKLLLSQQAAYEKIRERIVVAGRAYDLALRFKRSYKPYSLTLKDVRTDYYPGTKKPRNYSSDVRFVDADREIERDVLIWMNNPLRYEGETFYQSKVVADSDQTEMTGLQVVENPNWMLPYVACMVAMVGMGSHFSRMLPNVFKRDRLAPATIRRWSQRDGVVVTSVLAIAGLWYASEWRKTPQSNSDGMRFDQVGQLPVVYEGRIKPLDSVARNTLQAISMKQVFKDENGKPQPAIRWLLDAIAKPEESKKHRVFRINSAKVLGLLKVEPNDGFVYSVDDVLKNYAGFEEEVARVRRSRAGAKDKTESSPGDMQILETSNRFGLFMHVVTAMHAPPLRAESLSDDLLAAIQTEQQIEQEDSQPPRIVPPLGDGGTWKSYRSAKLTSMAQQFLKQPGNDAALSRLDDVFVAYADGNAERFNAAVAAYQDWLRDNPPAGWTPGQSRFEQLLNRAEPFYYAAVFYAGAILLALLSALFWPQALRRAGFALVLATLVLHTFGLAARIYVSGRPPVTNLYASALFVGWAGVVTAIILERWLKNSVGVLLGGLIGSLTLLIAHNLSADGDTLNVMEAVLDTTFWLATHVIIINLGYAATAAAGLLGLIYCCLLIGMSLTPGLKTTLYRSIYGVLCFAILFSLIGTVLGGLWADDSWGRFWGWDPKENGALIIVLWNALVLHARWGGIVKENGLAMLAVAGNIAVTWSWFGTNLLGIGLHSYGFREGTAWAMAGFIATQLIVIFLTMLLGSNTSADKRRPAAT